MALDPNLKAAIENWWKTCGTSLRACPGCGRSAPPHESMELNDVAIMVACESCGHAYIFCLDALKKRMGIP